jgi:hypothetical protein
MSSRTWILIVLSLFLSPGVVSGTSTARRFVLAAGANSGGHERVPLRYAVSDAVQFADVMTKMGGVEASDHLLLKDPNLQEFVQALERMQALVSTSSDGVGRTEIMFYYSGHADEEGLLLGEERVSYKKLRQMMDQVPADVRITVLDACASGAITRIKGGQRRQAFLVDDSSDMKGYAFLTSSSADEAAQESDQIGSSFFTHYLVSGMRGAADVSGDSKVSLTEAYEFAFDETLASTTETRGGAQHPAYEINLSGTGDVVMTDLREISAGLLLTQELSGRFFVRNAKRHLVAELFKPEGRSIELGLEPGTYRVYMAKEEELFLGTKKLDTGDRVVLQLPDFQPTDLEETVLRGIRPGGPAPGVNPRLTALARRTRIELGMGVWSRGPKDEEISGDGSVKTTVSTWNLAAGLGVSHWLRDDLSVGLNVGLVAAEVNSVIQTDVRSEELSITSVMVSARKYFPSARSVSPLLPYLSGGVGTFIASVNKTTISGQVATETGTMSAFAAQVGGGFDVPLNRLLMIGAEAGVTLASDFPEPVGGRENYGGFRMSVSLSLILGKGIHALS